MEWTLLFPSHISTSHDTILTVPIPPLHTVHVSFEKYRSLPSSYLEDDSLSSDELEEELAKPVPQTTTVAKGRRRSKGVPVGMPTKHDPEICGRRNVRNMEKFPPDFPSGDLMDESRDYRLPNSVFNTLRQHSYKEEKHVSSLFITS